MKFKWHDGILYFSGLSYAHIVLLISMFQSFVMILTWFQGHFKIHKILELATRSFWGPRISNSVKDYMHTCDTCCKTMMPPHRPYGLQNPLTILEQSLQFISLDFITDLPLYKGFDVILTIVYQFTKMAHFIPCINSINSEETTNLVMRGFGTSYCESIYCRYSRSLAKSLLVIHKRMVKLNALIKHCNNIFIVSLASNRIFFISMSFHTTIQCIPLLRSLTTFFAYNSYHPQCSFLQLPRVFTNPSAKDRFSQL